MVPPCHLNRPVIKTKTKTIIMTKQFFVDILLLQDAKTKTMTIIMNKQCFVDILLLQDAKLVGAMTNLKSCKGKNESKLAAAARTKCLTQMRACNGYVEQVSLI